MSNSTVITLFQSILLVYDYSPIFTSHPGGNYIAHVTACAMNSFHACYPRDLFTTDLITIPDFRLADTPLLRTKSRSPAKAIVV